MSTDSVRQMSPRVSCPGTPPTPLTGRVQSPLASPECDIVKKGLLYVKRPPSSNIRGLNLNIKTWQKRYLVLRDTSSESDTTTLDIFDRDVSRSSISPPVVSSSSSSSSSYSFSSWHRSTVPAVKSPAVASSTLALLPSGGHLTIDLRLVTRVDVYQESRRFLHAFIINRSDGTPLIFGVDTDLEKRCWVSAIKSLSDKVKSWPSHSSEQQQHQIPRRPSCPPRIGREVLHHPVLHSLASGYHHHPLASSSGLHHQMGRAGDSSPYLQYSLDGETLRLNRSTPQLNKVVMSTGSLHRLVDYQRSNSSASSQTSNGSTTDNSYIDIVESSVAIASDVTPNPLRRILSSSIFGGFSSSPKDSERRKDSGFSDSFEETTSYQDTHESSLRSSAEVLLEEISSEDQQRDCSPPPPPVPKRLQHTISEDRPMKSPPVCQARQGFVACASSPKPILPPRSYPSCPSDSPPMPPPRPFHTLS